MESMTGTQIVRRIALIDGINILRVVENKFERHLGVSEKPDWPKVRRILAAKSHGQCRCDYFANALKIGENFFSQARWMKAAGGIETRYCDQIFPGFDPSDPVDSAIQCEIDGLADKATIDGPAHIILFAHDHGYAPHAEKAISAGCLLWICGLGEEMHNDLTSLRTKGAQIVDLEYDLKAFAVPIPNRPPLSTLKRLKLTLE